MKDFPVVANIQKHQEAQKARIYNTFVESGDDSRNAKLITKADFEENYPSDKFERYSLGAVQKFREDLMKAEGYTDEAFKDATKGLKSFIVQHESNKVIMFARQKEVGEK